MHFALSDDNKTGGFGRRDPSPQQFCGTIGTAKPGPRKTERHRSKKKEEHKRDMTEIN